jgi:hypothetical protein
VVVGALAGAFGGGGVHSFVSDAVVTGIGHHLASQQAPARLIPGPVERPGSDTVLRFSTLPQ